MNDSGELSAASRTPFALLGAVNAQIATIEFLAVRALNDFIDIVAFHLYETEATRTTRLSIRYDCRRLNRTE